MGWGLCKDMLGLKSLGHMDLKFQGMPFARFDHSLKVPRVIERHAFSVIKKIHGHAYIKVCGHSTCVSPRDPCLHLL